MSGGGGSGGNTVTQVQQIPAYEQQSSMENQALAKSLASQAYPQYQGPLIQPQNSIQQGGQNLAINSAYGWQPSFNAAQATAAGALNPAQFNGLLTGAQRQDQSALNPAGFNAYEGAAGNQIGNGLNAAGFNAYENQAGNAATVQNAQGAQAAAARQAQALTNPNAVAGYMNPFVQQALAPQISDLNLQLAGQQNQLNAQAAQAGAFGDARQGAAQAMQNYFGNQALNQLIGTGYNNAYTQALNALGQAQGTQLGAAGQFGNIGQLGLGEQNLLSNLAGQQQQEQGIQLQGAQQYAGLAGQQQAEQGLQLQGGQQLGQLAQLANMEQNTQLQGAGLQGQLANQLQQQELTGANAVYNAGTQQQTQMQNELNAAYQQYLNQVNWPYQMLNVRESALSNSPYNIATAVTLPEANSTAQGFGTLAGAAGLLGGLAGGANTAPFGGQQMQGTR